MPLIRPSLIIQAYLRPEEYNENVEKEFKRSYIYMAQSIVKSLAEDELEDGNVLRLSIRLLRPYWDANDTSAQEMWCQVMRQWLKNVTYNISNAMVKYNQVMHPFGCVKLHFDYVDFEFDKNVLLRVKIEDDTIPENMPELAELARAYMNEAAFGEKEISLIRMPSCESYATQKQAYEDACEAACAESADEVADEVVSTEVVQMESEAHVSASDEGAIDEATSIEAESDIVEDGNAADGYADGTADDTADEQVLSSTAMPTFVLDYSTWGIEYADGTIEEFGAFAR